MSKVPIWFDCDTGVDDAVAILLANYLEEIDILGISTLSGNVTIDKTTANTIKVCDLMGKKYPVYPGASKPWIQPYESAVFFHGENGIGDAVLPDPSYEPEKELAWDALYRVAKEQNGELEVVAVGPMTNIATALSKYPELSELIKRILIMGGAAVGGNCTPCAEFNIYTDPHAAQAVFRSGVPVVMCGLDVTLKAYITPEEVEEISRQNTPVTKFFKESTQKPLNLCLGFGLQGLCMHDSCPLLYLVHPEIFKAKEAGVYVETRSELTLGKTVTDLFSDYKFEKKNAVVVLDIDRDAMLKIMKEALCSY